MSVKIIAEVGSNWSTFEDAKNSVILAKNCGADAVKFQLFDFASLYGWQNRSDEDGNSLHKDMDTLIKGVLPHDWLPKLKEKADACGIEFMCSAFSPELIDVVDPFVKTHKVASSELTHIRMLQRLAAIGKPVILSTGASGMGDIKKALEVLGSTPVTLLYCVAAYPARFVDLNRFEELKNFGRPVGFSDHTTDVAVIPGEMVRRGAIVIEKHVNFCEAQGPDADHSLNTAEFKAMVDILRGRPAHLNEETAMYTQHNRRLIAIKDIQPGDKLVENENFGIYRSLVPESKALSPWMIDQVIGREAKAAVKAGEGIGPGVI